jgi:Protein of unknown function (DUF664)
MSDETQVLLQFLDAERDHVLGILEGLSEEQLRQPVLPSGWNCLGLVKHLALADEHYWFRSVVGGESFDFFPQGLNAEWQVDPGESAEAVFNFAAGEGSRWLIASLCGRPRGGFACTFFGAMTIGCLSMEQGDGAGRGTLRAMVPSVNSRRNGHSGPAPLEDLPGSSTR